MRGNESMAKTILRSKPVNVTLPTSEEKKEFRRKRMVEVEMEFHSIPDKLARSKFFYVNYQWKQRPITDARQWFYYVDRYYPHAEGGPMFIDDPKTEEEINRCKEKAIALLSEGKRYVYILRKQSVDEILSQLEGVTNVVD
jgi:hypothetical protein